MAENNSKDNILGYVIIFSFLSVIISFFAILLFATINNYGVGELYSLLSSSVLNGLIPSDFQNIADSFVSSTPEILSVVDYFWFISFVTMIFSSLISSYNAERGNYFNLFSMLVLGVIFFVYIGSYFTQVTNWFINELFFKVLPNISTYIPLLNWYLNNVYTINIILFCLNVVANYVDLDFSKYNRRKEGDKIEQI